MALMKAVQVSKPGGPFELIERPIPEPGRGQVRIKVEACGVCHSDVIVKDGLWPGLPYPRIPGHEVIGAVLVVTTRGMFNTLIPVLVIERGKASVLSSQASYSTWRDFGAAVGPLSAPWLFLNVAQGPLYAALAAGLGVAAWGCLVRR